MEVALARAHADVEVDEPPHGQVERRRVRPRHAAVEDEAGVGAALVGGEKVDDRVAADLLLAVEGDPDVDREGALLGEQARGLQERGRSCPCRRPRRARRASRREAPARRDPTPRGRAARAAGRRSARRGGRSGRRRRRSRRRSHRRRAGALRGDELGLARRRRGRTRRTHSPDRTTSSAWAGIGAHARDAQPVGELREPGQGRARCGHGARSLRRRGR